MTTPLGKAITLILIAASIAGAWTLGLARGASAQSPPAFIDTTIVEAVEDYLRTTPESERHGRRAGLAEAVWYMAIEADEQAAEARERFYCDDPEPFYRVKCSAFRLLAKVFRETSAEIRRRENP